MVVRNGCQPWYVLRPTQDTLSYRSPDAEGYTSRSASLSPLLPSAQSGDPITECLKRVIRHGRVRRRHGGQWQARQRNRVALGLQSPKNIPRHSQTDHAFLISYHLNRDKSWPWHICDSHQASDTPDSYPETLLWVLILTSPSPANQVTGGPDSGLHLPYWIMSKGRTGFSSLSFQEPNTSQGFLSVAKLN